MEVEKLITTREIFVSYVSGTIWLTDFLLLALKPDRILSVLAFLKKATDRFPLDLPNEAVGLIVGVVSLLAPYIVGIALLPLSVGCAELIDKCYEKIGSWKPCLARIDAKSTTTCNNAHVKASEHFGIQHDYNRAIEAFLLHTDSKLSSKLTRFGDQIYLYDTLMFPFPLMIWLVFYNFGSQNCHARIAVGVLAFLILLMFIHRSAVIRAYHRLSLAIGYFVAVASSGEQKPTEIKVSLSEGVV